MTGTTRRERRPTTSTAIRFPADLHDALVKAAAERGLSINFLVVRAVADFLPRLIPADELTLVRPHPTPEASHG